MSSLADHDVELAKFLDPSLHVRGLGPAACSGVETSFAILALLRVVKQPAQSVIRDNSANDLCHRSNACTLARDVPCAQLAMATLVQLELHLDT